MSNDKKRPGVDPTTNPGVNPKVNHFNDLQAHFIGQAEKSKEVLKGLASGRSYNRFEAERKLHDHCLPSTISTLQKKYGIVVSRKFEFVCGHKDTLSHVKRYWLKPKQRAIALKILEEQDAKIIPKI